MAAEVGVRAGDGLIEVAEDNANGVALALGQYLRGPIRELTNEYTKDVRPLPRMLTP